jgi:hypothetical protein
VLPLAIVVVASSLLWSASLFVQPSAPGRREALQSLAGAVATTFGTQAAWADAYGSKPWALTKYGPTAIALEADIDAGDMKKVMKNEGTFKALNGFWMFSPQDYGKKQRLVSEMMAAAEDGQQATVKKIYTEYMSDPDMQQYKNLPRRPVKNMMSVGRALYTGSINNRGDKPAIIPGASE